MCPKYILDRLLQSEIILFRSTLIKPILLSKRRIDTLLAKETLPTFHLQELPPILADVISSAVAVITDFHFQISRHEVVKSRNHIR